MVPASALISQRIVVGREEDRLADLAGQIDRLRSPCCVVLDESGQRFVGIVRLAEVAKHPNAGHRILADLISPIPPLSVRADEPAADVARLLVQHAVDEAVIEDAARRYVGLVTLQAVLSWLHAEREREHAAVDRIYASLAHELRTPLNPILLMASDQAMRTDLPTDVRAAFQLIAESATDESHRIDQLIGRSAAPAALPAPTRSATRSPSAARAAQGAVVLVVEDHAPSRSALRDFLARKGFQVLTADTAAAALALAGQHHVDLVISDLGLPDGSGYALMTELQRRHQLGGIAVSAWSAPDDVARSLAAGFAAHLAKPVTSEALEPALAEFFKPA